MSEKFSPNRGFSLIEMLTVIAIIGIFAGIVIVVVGSARKQAKEARISSDLVQLQNQAEILYLDDGNYSNVRCTTTGSPEVQALCDDVSDQGSLMTIRPSLYTYCAYAVFPFSIKGYCVDSAGFSDKLAFPSLSCDFIPFCEYRDCPDFNANGVVECSNDPDPEEASNCPFQSRGVPGSDLYCIFECHGLSSSNLPSECGVDPCPPRGDAGNPGRCGEDNEICLAIYDINEDGVVDLPNDILGVILLLGTVCE
ncbi:prepilin-type N-terminal cleavage/methylation domain-containing protein [Patescibacteria group bacterium]|nr:prepilin-type N-terminal cleavage/methylation domain-containing protein [Patescibacteria group bacterium]